MAIYYHATDYSNLASIISNGLYTGIDDIVYLTKTKEDAVKFAYFHGKRQIVVFGVKLPESEIFETFDHSYAFFKCNSFGYAKNIPAKLIIEAWKYDMSTQ